MTLAALLLALALGAGSGADGGSSAPADSTLDCPGGRAVTRAELRAAGAGRVGDALRLAAPLTAWTVDGFEAAPRDGRGALALLVDGVPWTSGTSLEPERLDALPLTVSEVEAVVYCPGPRLVRGRLAGATLDVRTAPPPRLAGLADYGNETGDPGPARYLDPTLPNVDHWGPDGELVGRAGPAWASVRARSFLPTDTAIVARTARVSARFPEHQTLAATVAARHRDGALRLTSWASGELPYLPFARRELAIRRTALRGAAEARLGRLELAAWGGVQRLGAPPWAAPASEAPPSTDWREATASVVLGAPLGAALRVGLRGDLTHATGDEHAPADGVPVAPASARAAVGSAWAAFARGRLDLAVEATAAPDASGDAVPGGGVVAGLALGAYRLTLAARRSVQAAAPDVGYWHARGLAPLTPTSAPGRDAPTDALDLRLDADAAPRVLGPGRLTVQAALAGGWRQTPELVALPEAPFAQTERWARRWAELTADAVWRAGRWTLRTDAALATTASSTPGVWPAPPALRLGAGTAWRPDQTLDLSARLEATSAADSRAVRGGLPSRVPGGLVLDLAARRSVWGDRLALALVGHNVLGAPEQPSAVGARLGPRLFGRLSLRL